MATLEAADALWAVVSGDLGGAAGKEVEGWEGWDKRHMIYAITEVGDGSMVKIGFVNGCPEKDRRALMNRIRALEIGNPRRLQCVALDVGDILDEKQLHAEFAYFNVRGEWFKNEGAVKAWIDQRRVAERITTKARRGHLQRCRWPHYCNCARCKEVARRVAADEVKKAAGVG